MIMEVKSAKRLEELDIAKGMAIICVILGHLGISSINRVVYVFHMPLFFFISGYLISQKDPYFLFVKHKAKRLLRPYFYTCMSICLLSIPLAIYQGKPLLPTIFKWLGGCFYGSGGNMQPIIHMPVFIGALWFLLALFWGLLFVRRIIDVFPPLGQFVAVVSLAWIGYETAKVSWWPWDIQAGMTAGFFIYVGYLSRKLNVFNREMQIDLALCSFITVVWCISYFKGFWMVGNIYKNGIMDVFGALSSIYLIIYFCKMLKKFKKINKALSWWGGQQFNYSLFSYC